MGEGGGGSKERGEGRGVPSAGGNGWGLKSPPYRMPPAPPPLYYTAAQPYPPYTHTPSPHLLYGAHLWLQGCTCQQGLRQC